MIDIKNEILKATEAQKIKDFQLIQNLWSGYGEIKRYQLEGGKVSQAIVKHIKLPEINNHPKGWNTALSHQRKLRSYEIESYWYRYYANKTPVECRIPSLYHALKAENELLLIMEDLDARGYPIRIHHNLVTIENVKSCLKWMARFHAEFLNHDAEGLWPVGSYWHLDTRKEEWDKMENTVLKDSAKAIDEVLQNAKYQTIIHGDAKLANFCFSEAGEVSAVDFQYVGKGCGMKDIAYFISSCFEAKDCDLYEEELLNYYFQELQFALPDFADFSMLKEEWNYLYKFAWADFYRFLDGWSPGHWKMHHYSKMLKNRVLEELERK